MLKDKVKKVRKEMKLTQVEFAKRLGISRSYLSDIELGRLKGTNVKIISKLSDITGKPMEYFLDKDTTIKSYDILDAALDMMISNNLVNKEGEITDEAYREIIWNILKKEIQIKMDMKTK